MKLRNLVVVLVLVGCNNSKYESLENSPQQPELNRQRFEQVASQGPNPFVRWKWETIDTTTGKGEVTVVTDGKAFHVRFFCQGSGYAWFYIDEQRPDNLIWPVAKADYRDGLLKKWEWSCDEGKYDRSVVQGLTDKLTKTGQIVFKN